MTANPYQDVIDWLQSPEGCQWSENRISSARDGRLSTLIVYGPHYGGIFLGGVLSIKEDG